MLNVIIGTAAFLLATSSVLYSTHLTVRRYAHQLPAAVRLVATGVLYYAGVIVILQGLALFHAMTRGWVTLVCLLLACLLHFVWGAARDIPADAGPVMRWIRDGLSSRWAVLLVVCGCAVMLSFSRALLMPPLAWDCLTYHLTSAALWVQKGTIFIFDAPDQIAENAYFPINGELFACWLLLFFRNDLLINTMNFPITFLGGIACYAIARELGLNRKEASFAPALVCFAPMIYTQITTAYVDNATFSFFCASVLFGLRYLRRGGLCDSLLAHVAAGIALGIKYIAMPAVGLIFLAALVKTTRLPTPRGLYMKSCIVLLGFCILCLLGGRQYLHNAVEAHNPLYPFPVAMLGKVIFQGAESLTEVNRWVTQFEAWKGLDQFGFWEREYRKFLYLVMTAGPKFFLFLLLGCSALFIRPAGTSGTAWYFLFSLWTLPFILYYADASAAFVKRAIWIESSTRFLSPFIALFTIQGLVVIKRLRPYLSGCDYLLALMVGWDLLQINKNHLWEVAVAYPLAALMMPIALIMLTWVLSRGDKEGQEMEGPLLSQVLCGLREIVSRPLVACGVSIVVMAAALCFLQSYRDATRYRYYREHIDLHDFPRSLVDAWEFLDCHGEKKRIALTVAWEPPGHTWFWYPLLGGWLQNDIAYISAKHASDVPAWADRGSLRGGDASLWLDNLKRNEIDYIVVVNNLVYPFVMNRGKLFQEEWPPELGWMQARPDQFRLVFTDRCCKIFGYSNRAPS